MNSLIEKMRKARELRLSLPGMDVTVTRPTDLDAVSMTYDGIREAVEDVSKFVTGWHKVAESDLWKGGTDKEVAFSQDLFSEWLKDNPDAWSPLVQGVLDAYKAHAAKREETEKN